MNEAEDSAVRALEALIAAELIAPDGAALHFDAVGRAIDGSGLSLAVRMQLRDQLTQRARAVHTPH